MNPLDWRKAAALVTQYKQEATMAETDQLSSMLLSQIAIDDSGPPVMHYARSFFYYGLQFDGVGFFLLLFLLSVLNFWGML